MGIRRQKVRRLVAAASISLLGVVLLLIPLVDIYDDHVVPPQTSLSSTALENFVLAALALVLVGSGVWLYRREWDTDYVVRTATWTVGGTVLFAASLGWVVAIQRLIQGRFKPIFITGGAIVIGAVAVFAIGVYDTRRSQRDNWLTLERDRLSALFDNTTDAIAAVDFSGDGTQLLESNDAFDAVVDDMSALFYDIVSAYDDPRGEQAMFKQVRDGDSFRIEVEHTSNGENRSFIVQVIPYFRNDGDEAFIVMTDVTDQKQLAREVAARSRIESLHSVTSDMTGADSEQEVYDLAMEAGGRILEFDAACLIIDGETVATRGVDTFIDADIAASVAEDEQFIEADGGSRISTSGGRIVLTTPVGDRGVFQARATHDFTAAEINATELLVTHLDETLERIEFEHDLREERERLELLNRILRHDLLDGMNTVRMQAQLLDGHVDEESDDNRELIVDRVDDMADLVQTARSFMQTTIGNESLALESIRVDEVIRSELSTVETDYPDADLSVEGDLPTVTVEANDLLEELLTNLLVNAIEHNDEETPRVIVSMRATDDEVVIDVSDNGPGIPPTERDRLFEKGQKDEQSSGTGLGLYFCRELIDSYGGSISVDDSEIGGTTFTVRLPRTA
ncbi:MAG: signal transduction histidine kinase [Natronomonas sp.]|jgi:signal transduction histidine kinase|uniref:ATP-binding protein n=1 Tax=Natronomonas sp. TaxID=2184060 RepID=UPI00398A1684